MTSFLKQILFIFFLCFYFNASFSQAIIANWQPIGPDLIPVGTDLTNELGRVSQIKFDPVNPNRIYVISANGGLWISNNNAQSWNVSGTDKMPLTSTASICIDHTNNQILYLGTGDGNYGYYGLGVWKSIDGGQTWNPSNTGIGNRVAYEIVMNPVNHNQVIAATSDGIWKTIDGGNTWIQKGFGTTPFLDIVYKPGSVDTLYAVTTSEFMRSLDNGETWTHITNGVFVPNPNFAGMRIGVCKTSPNIVYIGMVADGGTILKSTDAGSSFTTVHHDPNGLSLVGYNGAAFTGQGNYNFCITVDPLNADNIYLGSHNVWKSTDGGVNWTIMNTHWWEKLHTDMHDMKFSPYYPTHLYNANDGGVCRSIDDAVNWTTVSDGLQITEIYNAAQHPIVRDLISVGTQDNGGLNYKNNVWNGERGGDVREVIKFGYHPNGRVFCPLSSYSYSLLTNTSHGWTTPYTTPFMAQYLMSLTDISFVPSQMDVAFLFYEDVYNVWRTSNISATAPSWTNILTTSNRVLAIDFNYSDTNLYVLLNDGKIIHSTNALAATPLFDTLNAPVIPTWKPKILASKITPSIVYMIDGNKIFRSSDNGQSWTDITSNLPNTYFLRLIEDEYSIDESIYIATYEGIYYRNNTMTTWANYSNGLPTISHPEELMVYNDGSNQSVLRVAFWGRGVWESPLYKSAPASNNDLESINTVLVYPNPNSGSFLIKLFEPEKYEIEITNNLGQKINCILNKNNDGYFVENVSKGLYILSVTNINTRLKTSRKVIVN